MKMAGESRRHGGAQREHQTSGAKQMKRIIAKRRGGGGRRQQWRRGRGMAKAAKSAISIEAVALKPRIISKSRRALYGIGRHQAAVARGVKRKQTRMRRWQKAAQSNRRAANEGQRENTRHQRAASMTSNIIMARISVAASAETSAHQRRTSYIAKDKRYQRMAYRGAILCAQAARNRIRLVAALKSGE